jgi:predicted RNase H-like HicB family nuclease
MTRAFSVIISSQPGGGFFVECPTLPGCYSQGETETEALENIREAIELALEDMAETGEPVPDLPPPTIAEVRVSA